jgi:hypothetical protein
LRPPPSKFGPTRSMAKGRKYFRKRHLTVAQQVYFMRELHPQFRVTTNRGHRARWIGDLRPSSLSDIYRVEISYTIPRRPEIRVLSPELRIRPGLKRLPHVFDEDKLCVHQAHEWAGDLSIAKTIIPWIMAWLYFYEVWYATGFWEGGGTHPHRPEHRRIQCHEG